MHALVVEDQPKMASLIRQGLVEEGYAVDLAADGEEALSYAAETEYGVIVLDVMLPGIDGLEVCRRLRERGTGAPIVIVSADGRSVLASGDARGGAAGVQTRLRGLPSDRGALAPPAPVHALRARRML